MPQRTLPSEGAGLWEPWETPNRSETVRVGGGRGTGGEVRGWDEGRAWLGLASLRLSVPVVEGVGSGLVGGLRSDLWSDGWGGGGEKGVTGFCWFCSVSVFSSVLVAGVGALAVPSLSFFWRCSEGSRSAAGVGVENSFSTPAAGEGVELVDIFDC